MNYNITFSGSFGVDTGPNFGFYDNVDGYITQRSAATKTQLENTIPWTITNIDAAATTIRLKSIGTCTNYTDYSIPVPTTTTTTTPGAGTTTTTTTTLAPGTTTTTTTAASTVPSVTLSAVDSITDTTATAHYNLTDGGSPVTERGVCWSTSTTPTTANDKNIDGTGAGSFISNIIGLTAGVTYYVRAYAINGVGTSYSNQISFATTVTIGQVQVYRNNGGEDPLNMCGLLPYQFPTPPFTSATLYKSGPFQVSTTILAGSLFTNPALTTPFVPGGDYYWGLTFNTAVEYKVYITTAGQLDTWTACAGSTTTTTAAPTTTTTTEFPGYSYIVDVYNCIDGCSSPTTVGLNVLSSTSKILNRYYWDSTFSNWYYIDQSGGTGANPITLDTVGYTTCESALAAHCV